MPDGIPSLRFWKSRKITLQGAEMGFSALQVLERARGPRSVTDLANSLGYRKNGVQSALLANVLLALHKTGSIEGDGKISRLRLSGDLTRVSITPQGRQLLKEAPSRRQFARRLLERS